MSCWHCNPGGVTRPQNGYIGSMPGSNPCSYLCNRVKYRGQNATSRDNIGDNTLHSGKI